MCKNITDTESFLGFGIRYSVHCLLYKSVKQGGYALGHIEKA